MHNTATIGPYSFRTFIQANWTTTTLDGKTNKAIADNDKALVGRRPEGTNGTKRPFADDILKTLTNAKRAKLDDTSSLKSVLPKQRSPSPESSSEDEYVAPKPAVDVVHHKLKLSGPGEVTLLPLQKIIGAIPAVSVVTHGLKPSRR